MNDIVVDHHVYLVILIANVIVPTVFIN